MRKPGPTTEASACPRLRAWTAWTVLALTLVWGPAARLLHVVEITDPAEGASTRTVTLLWNAQPVTYLHAAASERSDSQGPAVQPVAQDDADTPAHPRMRLLADDHQSSRADDAPLQTFFVPHKAAAPWLAHAPPDGRASQTSYLPAGACLCAAAPRAPPAL